MYVVDEIEERRNIFLRLFTDNCATLLKTRNIDSSNKVKRQLWWTGFSMNILAFMGPCSYLFWRMWNAYPEWGLLNVMYPICSLNLCSKQR